MNEMDGLLSAIDLCAGPGGVTTGYKAAGFQVVAAVDVDSNARATYASNHPEVDLLADDLLKLDPGNLLERVGLQPGELGVLTACVPCQTFSTLGRKARRASDPRNRLVGRVGDFAQAMRPHAVVMENVPPLERDSRFKRLVSRLRRLGYGVWHGVVDAADFGVPQRRRRLVMIALAGVEDKDVPPFGPNHPILERFCKRSTVRTAFETLKAPSLADPLSIPRTDYPPLIARRIAAVPPDGGSRGSLPPELELRCHARLRKHAAGNVYGRMAFDDVAPTLTTRCTTPACGRYLHPVENRAITLREAAILQSFPPDYHFHGGSIAIQSQIGNAVPPRLARAIGELVRHSLIPLNQVEGTVTPPASSPETRARMQKVRRRDTPREVALRSELHRRGLRFRIDTRPLKGLRRRADIVFGSARVAVFVDGCFWHGCPSHGSWPKMNREWWRQKIDTTKLRDSHTDQELLRAGWDVIRVWEHEDTRVVANTVERVVRQRQSSAALVTP